MGSASDDDFLTSEAKRLIGNASARQITRDPALFDTAVSSSNDNDPALSGMISRAMPRLILTDRQLQKPLSRKELSEEICANSIEGLLAELDPNEPPPRPRKQVVHGVFFGSQLLYPGWWSRPAGKSQSAFREWEGNSPSVKNICRWLNAGYEQWGPSCDLWNPREKSEFLFGQIGAGDEANSLNVIIAPEAAARLRSDMESKLAVGVVAQGKLFHSNHARDELNQNARLALDQRAKIGLDNMSFFLFVSDFEPDGSISKDFIEVDRDQPSIYSAYMWRSLIRKSDEFSGRAGTIKSPRVIVAWEHTNLLDRDCVKFNYESLVFKTEYLRDKLGEDLLLFQHSYSLETFLNEELHRPLIGSRSLSKIVRAAQDALSSDDTDNRSPLILSLSKTKNRRKTV